MQDYRRRLQDERQATEAARARVQELEIQVHDQEAAAAQSAHSALAEVRSLHAPKSTTTQSCRQTCATVPLVLNIGQHDVTQRAIADVKD